MNPAKRSRPWRPLLHIGGIEAGHALQRRFRLPISARQCGGNRPRENNSELGPEFSPIQFDDCEIRVGRLPYGNDGEQVLEQLREEHRGTHVFRRERADSICAVPVTADAPWIGEPRTIRLKKHLALAAALIRNALLTYVAGLGRTVLSYEPMKIIARDDLLRVSLPEGITPPEWLAVRLLYELAIRPVSFFNQERFVVAALDVRTIRIIERTAYALIEDGLSLKGFYVGKRVPNKDPRLSPQLKLVGCLQSVEGTKLRLTDFRDDIETINAKDAWLEKRAFAACLFHVFGRRAPEVAELLQRARAALRHGPARLHRIRKTMEILGREHHEMIPGVPFTFGPLLDNANSSFPGMESAPWPIYVFDPAGSKTHTQNDAGLNKHGPYTAQVFTPSQPRICIVCQQSKKGQVEEFLYKFLHGIKLTPPASPPYRGRPPKNCFEKGFCRKYRVEDVHSEFFLAENSSAESYKKACERAIERHGSGQKWDLAMIQIDEGFHRLPAERDPYFIAKVSFYTHQIPVQLFEIETAKKPDSELSFVLNNIGLATYAKLNGIPWLLKADPMTAHELVIGLGTADVGKNRLGGRERYVGITTVFSGDGNYHLSNLSKAVTMDAYPSTLLETLHAAVVKVQKEMNWQPNDHVRLVFHATFKRFSREEVQSVKALMRDLGDYEVEYAFVQLSKRHPYILFDTEQARIGDYETRRNKGIYAPERGRYLELRNREVLLSVTGPREVKRPEDGTPRPLFLSLHRDSSFTDMTYLTRQVFRFACHSWRTFQPVPEPVTIQYSNLIANSLGRLSVMERWNPDVMLGRIGRTRWFL